MMVIRQQKGSGSDESDWSKGSYWSMGWMGWISLMGWTWSDWLERQKDQMGHFGQMEWKGLLNKMGEKGEEV